MSRQLCLIALVCAALVGCATTTPKVVYQPVNVAVATSCVPASLGPAPKVDTPADLAALSGPERYTRAVAAYLALFARAMLTEPTLEHCR